VCLCGEFTQPQRHCNRQLTNAQRYLSEVVFFERRLRVCHLLEWKNAVDAHFEGARFD
jgi:hypothetical protein